MLVSISIVSLHEFFCLLKIVLKTINGFFNFCQ